MNDFITYGGWIVAILVVVIGAIINRWTASRTKQREIDSTPYELITEWVRRIDAAAFDYFQKASEKQEAWENATYGWESAKAEFNWVMGLVESLNDPDSLYKNLQEHYGYLLKYESIAQSRRNNRSNDSYALNT